MSFLIFFPHHPPNTFFSPLSKLALAGERGEGEISPLSKLPFGGRGGGGWTGKMNVPVTCLFFFVAPSAGHGISSTQKAPRRWGRLTLLVTAESTRANPQAGQLWHAILIRLLRIMSRFFFVYTMLNEPFLLPLSVPPTRHPPSPTRSYKPPPPFPFLHGQRRTQSLAVRWTATASRWANSTTAFSPYSSSSRFAIGRPSYSSQRA